MKFCTSDYKYGPWTNVVKKKATNHQISDKIKFISLPQIMGSSRITGGEELEAAWNSWEPLTAWLEDENFLVIFFIKVLRKLESEKLEG